MDGVDRVPDVAILHEWIHTRAGSEQVFERMARLLPDADLFTLSREPGVDFETGGRPLHTSWLDTPRLRGRRSVTLPLMPAAWRAFGSKRYDLVISSHHAFATANRLVRPGGTHLAYVYSPARYVWTPDVDDRGASRALAPVRRVLARADRRNSRTLDAIAVISTEIQQRVERFWERDSTVVHPPVDTSFFEDRTPEAARDRGYLLGMGRWIPYKNLEFVIAVGERAGLPVKIAGSGPLEAQLRARAAAATVEVEIVKRPSNEELRALYAHARALVFPNHEDFGIVPLEANAAGTPVVAWARGGALDTVSPGGNGLLVDELDVDAFVRALDGPAFAALDAEGCRRAATRFSAARFDAEFRSWVDAA